MKIVEKLLAPASSAYCTFEESSIIYINFVHIYEIYYTVTYNSKTLRVIPSTVLSRKEFGGQRNREREREKISILERKEVCKERKEIER